ncbi:hypothetical protein B5P45_18000 [Phyllobacterium zundukense]|uniref:Transposase IS4-like domain-containing protein n=2 Tax=Phyllobacterium zundukense TaxID=1867719 RepID=A0A2N9VV90_9HYPH|nr:hypothetical protein B5P45_18000 [Phyllobacterium zundukense]
MKSDCRISGASRNLALSAAASGFVPTKKRLHMFGSLKDWMGRDHFRMRKPRNVRTEMSLHILAYNIKRAIADLGAPAFMATMRE